MIQVKEYAIIFNTNLEQCVLSFRNGLCFSFSISYPVLNEVHDLFTMAVVEAEPFSFFGFGPGPGAIHLSALSCIGNESSLEECDYDTDVSFSFHFQDVGVRCYESGMYHSPLLHLGMVSPTSWENN